MVMLEGGRRRPPEWLGRVVNVVLFLAVAGAIAIVCALVFLLVVLLG